MTSVCHFWLQYRCRFGFRCRNGLHSIHAEDAVCHLGQQCCYSRHRRIIAANRATSSSTDVPLDDIAEQPDVCPITYMSIQTAGYLLCRHKFERRAILRWLRNESSCPVCRAPAVSSDVSPTCPAPAIQPVSSPAMQHLSSPGLRPPPRFYPPSSPPSSPRFNAQTGFVSRIRARVLEVIQERPARVLAACFSAGGVLLLRSHTSGSKTHCDILSALGAVAVITAFTHLPAPPADCPRLAEPAAVGDEERLVAALFESMSPCRSSFDAFRSGSLLPWTEVLETNLRLSVRLGLLEMTRISMDKMGADVSAWWHGLWMGVATGAAVFRLFVTVDRRKYTDNVVTLTWANQEMLHQFLTTDSADWNREVVTFLAEKQSCIDVQSRDWRVGVQNFMRLCTEASWACLVWSAW
eukprot:TRINITY_DN49475_c0_g1_i1.p1 TRINITY_DN49475_c0_g1~~TRINITY_DN49475_c0_g1_i1.p1  ORF type:complete len:409 (+),score=27.38 TRINITY_DN49475_c0_g1_i1:239-1465(+)